MFEKADTFFLQAKEAFSFLESEYGFKFVDTGVKNQEYFDDRKAEIRYIGNRVAVKVEWLFSSGHISASLIELLDSAFPDKVTYFGPARDLPRAINLYVLVKMIENGDESPILLKKVFSTKFSDARKRGQQIQEKMPDVLTNISNLLRKYAENILRGDLSIFDDVRRYQEDLLPKY